MLAWLLGLCWPGDKRDAHATNLNHFLHPKVAPMGERALDLTEYSFPGLGWAVSWRKQTRMPGHT